jgi:hypothetical protein
MKATTKVVTKIVAGMVLAVGFCGVAMADLIVGNALYQGASYGQQSDGNTSALIQTFTPPVDRVVDTITWWGFHGFDSNGASFDNFVVKLGDVIQTGVLTIRHVSDFHDEYTLDIVDALLNASTLSISNDSTDVEWYWQSAAAAGNANSPDASNVSFSLNGANEQPPANVPEPGTIGLMLLVLGGLFVRNRRV